tara:strand:+ start:33321 stop:34463 length:1143 start_codon:yes stop_codon:yes gene_type:complete
MPNTTGGDVLKYDERSDKASLELVSSSVSNVSAAIKEADIDMDLWRVDHYQINQFEQGSKGPDGRVVSRLTHQIKAWLVRRSGWSATEFKAKLFKEFKAAAPKYQKIKRAVKPGKDMLAVLGLFDAHFGQLSWPEETGAAVTVASTRERYRAAFQDLLSRCEHFGVSKILYVLGNDFLHVDTAQNATTKGTPQDVDGRWQQAFLCGMGCAFELVDAARAIAPVDILVVAGNHEQEKIFCMGEVMSARYHGASDVAVQNSPNPWQYYRYGTNLLGFNHGNGLTDAKRLQLPARMAQDQPELWAATTCREWFLGHLHRERETITTQRHADTINQVIVRELPALTGVDAWHNQQGFAANPQGELHLYSKERGRYGYFVHNPTV